MTDENFVIDGELKEIEDIVVKRGKSLESGILPLKTKDTIIDALKLVFDPEIDIDVYNLGLIYDIELDAKGNVKIIMTLTSPTCPMADEIPVWVAEAVADIEGVGEVEVNVVWQPVWDLSKLSEEAKFQMELGDLEI